MLFVAGALVLATGVVGVNWKRTSPIRLIWLLLSAWLVASVAVAVLTGLAWLMLDAPGWKPPENLSPRHLEAITIRAFAIVAGLGGVALLVIAYRRQRTTETGEEREVTKLFNERFTAAYTELGSEHAAVRLGAVHALAHLADDAPSEKEVQMVIDVLCAYLRMPYTPKPNSPSESASKEEIAEQREQELEYASSREVRHTIIRIIGDRLNSPTRWREKRYDFTGAVFDGGDLSGAVFSGGSAIFHKAKFIDGEMDFFDAKFTGGMVSFYQAEFIGGSVNFFNAEFSGGKVNFYNSEFIGGGVYFLDAKFTNGGVDFSEAKFTDGNISFYRAEFTGGKTDFHGARFAGGRANFSMAKVSGGEMSFDKAEFIGGEVDFIDTKFSGGKVTFTEARFSDGKVNFFKTYFTGGRVYFHKADFSDGEVNFVNVKLTDGRVDFQGASGRCPFNLLESIEESAPGVTILPGQWNSNPTGRRE